MAQYAVLIYAPRLRPRPDATPEDTETCDQHSDELVDSGVQVAAYALTPREMATSIRGDIITDGPFIDSKEIVAGFYIVEAPDLDAATVRVARDLDLAEECVQEAYASAMQAWVRSGIPDNPAAWLTTTAKRRAIDAIRKDMALRSRLPLLVEPEEAIDEVIMNESAAHAEDPGSVIPDERLRLIFTCCHPALAQEAQVALTLRLVCGVPVADVARAFLISEPTMAARITRAKKKISTARIPYRIPRPAELPERLRAVLAVIHLLFTDTGVQGLYALLLVTDARRATRADADGRLVRLQDQDRSRWDRAALAEADDIIWRWSPDRRPRSRKSRSSTGTDACRATSTCTRSKPTCSAASAAPVRRPTPTGRRSPWPPTKPSARSSPGRYPITPRAEHGRAGQDACR
jgi:RNA polymerase sigma factor (sigma-70 family)